VIVSRGGDQAPRFSRKLAEQRKAWDDIKEAFNSKARLNGRIQKAVEHGFIVSVGGLDLFMPMSQSGVRPSKTITVGQELDLRRFAEAKSDAPTALQSEAELDDYTFRVAGCVGEFWTRMCRTHIFPGARLDDAWLIEKGIRFGKGLQLVNILRDVPADLRKGRCYFPADGLTRLGLQPHDLLDSQNETRFRPLYNDWLGRARAHLAAGWEYTTALPWPAVRVRLACALPILVGLDTLALLETGPILNPERRIKVGRPQVKRAFRRSILLYPFPAVWKGLVCFR
jgi:farnesyl-diphosphate farnesyltransferase